MKKILLVILLFTGILKETFSQDLYFKTGLNHTTYDFKDQNGDKISGLLPGTGSTFELGLGIPLVKKEWLKYAVGLTMDSYNAKGGDLNNNYSWDTNYAGVRNTISFFPTSGKLNPGVQAIFGASKIFGGSQVINNSRYELKNHPEFNGMLLQAGLGLSASYNVFNQGNRSLGYLSLGYDFTKSFKIGESTEEKLSYLNNRIHFGIHFLLD